MKTLVMKFITETGTKVSLNVPNVKDTIEFIVLISVVSNINFHNYVSSTFLIKEVRINLLLQSK